MGLIIIFFLLGLLLILVEIFVSPGFVAGVVGIIAMAIAIYMTFESYGNTKGWAFVFISTAIVVGSIAIALKSGVWKKLALNENVKGTVHVNDTFSPEVGMEGIALSTIRPSGKAEFGTHTAEVHAESEFIETKSKVKIIKLLDNKIYVTKQ